MKRKNVILMAAMLLFSTNTTRIWADGDDGGIDILPFGFNVNGDENGGGLGSLPRTPVMPPTVGINGHTLYLYSGCDNTEIVLIGENETEVYSTYVLEGTTQVQLPSALQGTYELRILRGQFMFYTEIEL